MLRYPPMRRLGSTLLDWGAVVDGLAADRGIDHVDEGMPAMAFSFTNFSSTGRWSSVGRVPSTAAASVRMS